MYSRNVPAGEFKQKCLALMKEVAMSGEELIITKHGTPICRVIPVAHEVYKHRFGWMKDTIKVRGDLTKPTGEKWEANE